MIRNVPNKYTKSALLQLIDMNHANAYDFFYLPIDFRNNSGNLGYAFLNLKDPLGIVALVEDFSGKRWERHKSEKVCEIAYAHIQGKQALMEHFRCSRLMSKHYKYRPLVADDDGQLWDYTSDGAEPSLWHNDTPLHSVTVMNLNRECMSGVQQPRGASLSSGSCSASSSCSSCSSSSTDASWHSFLGGEISLRVPSSPGLSMSGLMSQANEPSQHAIIEGQGEDSAHQPAQPLGIYGSHGADIDLPHICQHTDSMPLSPHRQQSTQISAEALAAASFGVLNMRPADEGGQGGALALRDSLGGMQQHGSSSLPSPMRQDPATAQNQRGRTQHLLPVGTQNPARLGSSVDGDEVRVCQPRGKIEQQLNRPVRDSDPLALSFTVPPGAAPVIDGLELLQHSSLHDLLSAEHDGASTHKVARALAMGGPAPHPKGPLQSSDDWLPPSTYLTIQEQCYQTLLHSNNCARRMLPAADSRGLQGQRVPVNYGGSIASPMMSPGGGERGGTTAGCGSDAGQFRVDFSAVLQGTDRRTTVMLRNVPNKYSKAALLRLLDQNYAGTYDFFYLPIDFRNKCNLGYAFINFRNPYTIVALAGQHHAIAC